MEYDLGHAIKAINEIRDNIWLGDLKAAKEIADRNLENIHAQLDISELENAATMLRKIIYKTRRDAREKNVKNKRLWVAEQVFEEMKKDEIDSVKNIFGVLTIHLSNLKETASYLSGAKAQRTLETFEEKSLEEEQVSRKNKRYRYSLYRLPGKWEVRAVLDTPARTWDLRKLGDQLLNYNLSMEEVSKRDASRIFELYSRDMYIQVLGQEKLMEILIRAPAREDVEKRVRKVVETILSSLTI